MDAACVEVLALLRRWIDKEGLSLFSELCRRDLYQLMKSRDAVALIEAQCTISDYRDAAKHAATNVAVARILRRRGVKRPRGKRTRPALAAFTRDVASVAASQGVRPSTGDNSRMVTVLRRVAAELQIAGDPRDELRRLARIERQQSNFAESSAIVTFLRAVRLE